MGAIPELAPVDEDHLLHSSTVVQRVQYGDRSLRYRTFDRDGSEVLRLTYKPSRVMAGSRTLLQRGEPTEEGYTVKPLPDGGYAVRIRRTQSTEIEIAGR